MFAMKKLLKGVVAGALLACAFTQGAMAAEVAGVTLKDSMKVGGKELVLNGYGIRNKFIVKVYVTSLYMPSKMSSTDDIFKADGPRRIHLVMLRDISADDFGSAFMAGINNNTEKGDKAKIVGQISKFGEMFASIPGLKKGDVLDLDYIPGTGTVCILNGKQIGETVTDVLFYNAIMKIWLGEKPADSSLKPKLLNGGKAPAASNA
jgi:hypothetical protein